LKYDIPENLKTQGDHVRRKRLELGLDQREVAYLIGVSPAGLAGWEVEGHAPLYRFYARIFAFLGYVPDLPYRMPPRRSFIR